MIGQRPSLPSYARTSWARATSVDMAAGGRLKILTTMRCINDACDFSPHAAAKVIRKVWPHLGQMATAARPDTTFVAPVFAALTPAGRASRAGILTHRRTRGG